MLPPAKPNFLKVPQFPNRVTKWEPTVQIAEHSEDIFTQVAAAVIVEMWDSITIKVTFEPQDWGRYLTGYFCLTSQTLSTSYVLVLLSVETCVESEIQFPNPLWYRKIQLLTTEAISRDCWCQAPPRQRIQQKESVQIEKGVYSRYSTNFISVSWKWVPSILFHLLQTIC